VPNRAPPSAIVQYMNGSHCAIGIWESHARLPGGGNRFRPASPSPLPVATEKAKAAAKRGEWYLSRGYSRAGAVGVEIPWLRDPGRAALFCSQLVARAYDEAGVQVVPGKTPETTAPGDLLKSPLLRDVTASALVLIKTDEPPLYYLDDASHFERPHHHEIITKLEVLYSKPVQDALTRLKENPGSFLELEIVLAKQRDAELDAAILSELDKRHFAEENLSRAREYANPEEAEKATRSAIEKIEHGNMSDEELRSIICQSATIHKQLEEDVRDRRQEHRGYEQGYVGHRLATFGYFASLQKRRLALSIECLNAKTRELNTLIPEAQRRGLEPGPPG
jgi:hypothetical protein